MCKSNTGSLTAKACSRTGQGYLSVLTTEKIITYCTNDRKEKVVKYQYLLDGFSGVNLFNPELQQEIRSQKYLVESYLDGHKLEANNETAVMCSLSLIKTAQDRSRPLANDLDIEKYFAVGLGFLINKYPGSSEVAMKAMKWLRGYNNRSTDLQSIEHGDMVASNIMIVNDMPVIIDYEKTQMTGLSFFDPALLYLSFLANEPFENKRRKKFEKNYSINAQYAYIMDWICENYNLRADEFHTALILSVMRKVSISVDENRVGVAEYWSKIFLMLIKSGKDD